LLAVIVAAYAVARPYLCPAFPGGRKASYWHDRRDGRWFYASALAHCG
jgi:hypothetical protein